MLKSVRVKVPGTCGELIQTCHSGVECLISLPIDRYTEIYVEYARDRVPVNALKPKSIEAVKVICDYLNIPLVERQQISIDISSQLDQGIGMASSTADVYGIMVAICLLFEKSLSPEMFGKLCAQIEPSDGIMFEKWTLFDHLRGNVLKTFQTYEPMDLFMLKTMEEVNTVALRNVSDYPQKLGCKSSQPLDTFLQYTNTGCIETLGLAMTQSVLENESILRKPMLGAFIELSKQVGAIGVIGAHSGSILALAFKKDTIDSEAMIKQLQQWILKSPYTHIEKVSTANGGYLLIERQI